MKTKPPTVAQIKKILAKRMKEVGAVRDRIRDNLDELESLAETCDKAYDALEQAADALSELA